MGTHVALASSQASAQPLSQSACARRLASQGAPTALAWARHTPGPRADAPTQASPEPQGALASHAPPSPTSTAHAPAFVHAW
jgi:hypothetical protein